MGLDPISAGLGAATGLISGITGLFQKSKANRLAKENVRPLYDIPSEIKANSTIAKTLSNQGLTGAQYAKQTQSINRNAANAVGAAQNRRSGLAAIGAVQNSTNDANLNLNVADSNARLANIKGLMQQNGIMANYRDKAWDWNNKQKYVENAAAIRALQGAGNANINSGLNSIFGGAAMGLNGGLFGSKPKPQMQTSNSYAVGDTGYY